MYHKPMNFLHDGLVVSSPKKTLVMSSMYIQPTKQGSKCCSDLKLEGTKNMHPCAYIASSLPREIVDCEHQK